VWLEAAHVPTPASARRVVLDQRNLAFIPTVLSVSVGATVRFPNHDRVLHNVFSFREGRRFDLGLYPVGQARDVTFDRPGVSRVLCNIHPGMAAYVVVVDSPYHAVSDDQGAFTLTGVVPGRYTYRTWRPSGQPVQGVVDAGRETAWEIRWPSK
jgi:plastocyanin